MLERTGQAVSFYAFFSADKQGKTGLGVTVDVRRSDGTALVTAATGVEIGGGLYGYTLAGASVNVAGGYLAIFKTTDTTVDFQHLPALWVVGAGWVQGIDATISSRAAAADILATPANKLVTNSTGQVQVDMAQSVPTTNSPQTHGDALNAARAQGFGRWQLSGTTLTLYGADGTTVVRTFTLDSATNPTHRQ